MVQLQLWVTILDRIICACAVFIFNKNVCFAWPTGIPLVERMCVWGGVMCLCTSVEKVITIANPGLTNWKRKPQLFTVAFWSTCTVCMSHISLPLYP